MQARPLCRRRACNWQRRGGAGPCTASGAHRQRMAFCASLKAAMGAGGVCIGARGGRDMGPSRPTGPGPGQLSRTAAAAMRRADSEGRPGEPRGLGGGPCARPAIALPTSRPRPRLPVPRPAASGHSHSGHPGRQPGAAVCGRPGRPQGRARRPGAGRARMSARPAVLL